MADMTDSALTRIADRLDRRDDEGKITRGELRLLIREALAETATTPPVDLTVCPTCMSKEHWRRNIILLGDTPMQNQYCLDAWHTAEAPAHFFSRDHWPTAAQATGVTESHIPVTPPQPEQGLVERLNDWTRFGDAAYADRKEAADTITQQASEIERLTTTVKFYADKENWKYKGHLSGPPTAQKDYGRLARATLSPTRTAEG